MCADLQRWSLFFTRTQNHESLHRSFSVLYIFRTVQHKGIDTTGYRFIAGRMSPDDRSNAQKHQIVNIMKLHPPNARLLTHAIRDILELENRLFLVAADAVILEHPGHCLASASSPCV
jgi:Lhr-like helicase